MSTIKANTWLNTDGTENFKCRAWVNFCGTGTVAIRASGNVSSITDNGTGNYTINMTNPMPDTNYSVSLTHGGTSMVYLIRTQEEAIARTTTSFSVISENVTPSGVDAAYVQVNVFR